MATFQVLNIRDARELFRWKELWAAWPCREVYAHPGYMGLYLDDRSDGYCAVLESDEGNVLYPFICRDLSKETYGDIGVRPIGDIVTPYGYGGQFIWDHTDPAALAGSFRAFFDPWAAERNIVSEVVKFSLFEKGLLPYQGEREERLKNIVVDLSPGEEALFMSFEHKVRKNVKKAVRQGVTVAADAAGAQLESFLRIYHGTLERRSAKGLYYFDAAFFAGLQRELPGQYMYFHALHEGQVISTELVLVSAESVYSFLGGTASDKFSLAPNDLLKFEIIKWARSKGKKYFVLGGGVSPDDGIYHYKRSFAPGGAVPFYVGTRVLRRDLYEKLVENRKRLERTEQGGWTPVPGFVPEYRT
jgi:hypothetical protein